MTRLRYVLLSAALVVVLTIFPIQAAHAFQIYPPGCVDVGQAFSWQGNCYTGQSYNDTGTYVAAVQDLLRHTEGYPVSVDCIFGGQTNLYTEEYQSAHGLGSDGIVGPNTWQSLQNLTFFHFDEPTDWPGGWKFYSAPGNDDIWKWQYFTLEPALDNWFVAVSMPAAEYADMRVHDPVSGCSDVPR